MKKISIMFLLVGALAFANGTNDVLEDRVENGLRANLSKVIKYETDYDVDIFEDKMNVEVEIESLKEPILDYDRMVDMILSNIKENAPEVKDINITVKYDQPIGEDIILFTKNYK